MITQTDQAGRKLPKMRRLGVILVVAGATVLHAFGWFLVQNQAAPPNVLGPLASVSFSPINPNQSGETDLTTEEQIKSDLAVIAHHGVPIVGGDDRKRQRPVVAACAVDLFGEDRLDVARLEGAR